MVGQFFFSCYQIPAAAWQQLRGAKWPELKKAYFDSYLAEREMVEGVCVFFWQCVLSTVQYLSRLDTFLQVQGQCHFLGKLLYCMT